MFKGRLNIRTMVNSGSEAIDLQVQVLLPRLFSAFVSIERLLLTLDGLWRYELCTDT